METRTQKSRRREAASCTQGTSSNKRARSNTDQRAQGQGTSLNTKHSQVPAVQEKKSQRWSLTREHNTEGVLQVGQLSVAQTKGQRSGDKLDIGKRIHLDTSRRSQRVDIGEMSKDRGRRKGEGHSKQDIDEEIHELLGSRALQSGQCEGALKNFLDKMKSLKDNMDLYVSHNTGGSNQKMKAIITSLKDADSDGSHHVALQELVEQMSVSSEDQLASLPHDQLVSVLTSMMERMEEVTTLQAAQCLHFLTEGGNSTRRAIARYGGLDALRDSVWNIVYIDVAESAISAINKIAAADPVACAEKDCMQALFANWDFFTDAVHRTIAEAVAAIAVATSPERAQHIQPCISQISGLLQNEDMRIVEHACLALTRIADGFSSSPAHLAVLSELGIVQQAATLVLEVAQLAYYLLPKTPEVSQLLALQARPARSTAHLCDKFAALRAEFMVPSISQPMVAQYADAMLPVMLRLHRATFGHKLRGLCLQVIGKVLFFGDAQTLESTTSLVPISSFIRGLISQQSAFSCLRGVALASMLLMQLGERVHGVFIREGVVHALKSLKQQYSDETLASSLETFTESLPAQQKQKHRTRHSTRLSDRQGQSSFDGGLGSLGPGLDPIEKDRSRKGKQIIDMRASMRETDGLTSLQPVSPHIGGDAYGTSKEDEKLPLAAALGAQLIHNHLSCIGDSQLESEEHRALRSIASSLMKPGQISKLLQVIADGVDQDETQVSTFDFIHSSIIDKLIAYLQGSDIPTADQDKHDQQLLNRLRQFVEVSLAVSPTQPTPLMLPLVKQLVSCIAESENLPLVSFTFPGNHSLERLLSGALVGLQRRGSASSGAGILAQYSEVVHQPYAVMLQAHNDSEGSKSQNAGKLHLQLSVQPLAQVSQVQEIAWGSIQRVYRASPIPRHTGSVAPRASQRAHSTVDPATEPPTASLGQQDTANKPTTDSPAPPAEPTLQASDTGQFRARSAAATRRVSSRSGSNIGRVTNAQMSRGGMNRWETSRGRGGNSARGGADLGAPEMTQSMQGDNVSVRSIPAPVRSGMQVRESRRGIDTGDVEASGLQQAHSRAEQHESVMPLTRLQARARAEQGKGKGKRAEIAGGVGCSNAARGDEEVGPSVGARAVDVKLAENVSQTGARDEAMDACVESIGGHVAIKGQTSQQQLRVRNSPYLALQMGAIMSGLQDVVGQDVAGQSGVGAAGAGGSGKQRVGVVVDDFDDAYVDDMDDDEDVDDDEQSVDDDDGFSDKLIVEETGDDDADGHEVLDMFLSSQGGQGVAATRAPTTSADLGNPLSQFARIGAELRSYARVARSGSDAATAAKAGLRLRYQGQLLPPNEQFIRAIMQVHFQQIQQELLEKAADTQSSDDAGQAPLSPSDDLRLVIALRNRIALSYDLLGREEQGEVVFNETGTAGDRVDGAQASGSGDLAMEMSTVAGNEIEGGQGASTRNQSAQCTQAQIRFEYPQHVNPLNTLLAPSTSPAAKLSTVPVSHLTRQTLTLLHTLHAITKHAALLQHTTSLADDTHTKQLKMMSALVNLQQRNSGVSSASTQQRAKSTRSQDAKSPTESSALHTLGSIQASQWVSQKLSQKVSMQLRDMGSVIGGSPAWIGTLISTCKFMLPFEVRKWQFYTTALGVNRAIMYLNTQLASEGRGAPAGTAAMERGSVAVQRQKVRLSRNRILESAMRIMEEFGKKRAVLELEFFGEAGTGLGPTLEFYTLLSHSLQDASLELWRNEDIVSPPPPPPPPRANVGGSRHKKGDHSGGTVGGSVIETKYVKAPNGLFPAPLPPSASIERRRKVTSHFTLLGRAVAKALADQRLMDLPLSAAFLQRVTQGYLQPSQLCDIDPTLASSLSKLYDGHMKWVAAGSRGKCLVDSVPVDDLCLTFTLPGYPDYQLVQDGDNRDVHAADIPEYISAVLAATLGEGVSTQCDSFKTGFAEVLPLHSLDVLHHDEIDQMLGGGTSSVQTWSFSELRQVVRVDHGYTQDSPQVCALLEVLVQFTEEQRRNFLKFVTGTPRLPPGGLASLNPRLTVVRKHVSNTTIPGDASPVAPNSRAASTGSNIQPARQSSMNVTACDRELPSVMTCANYIKLPPYTSKEVLQDRLLYAIAEGQGSFDLT